MWLKIVVAFAAVLLDPAQSNSGLTRTSFSNELRTGFARLFQNGVEQPLQTPPFVLLNPTDFQTADGPLIQRPPPFSPLAATGYSSSRPRYPFPPRGGGRRQNDVLVVVIKTKSNCTAPGNGTKPADGDDDDDDDDDDEVKGPVPDDDVEEVSIVAGGVEKGKEPSRCVWAILACCAPSNTLIRYTCFDVLGCSTAFWDTNPCVPAIVKTALDQATQFYGPTTSTNRTETPTTVAPPPPASPDPASSNNVAMDLRSFMASATAGTVTTVADTTVTDTTAADTTQAA